MQNSISITLPADALEGTAAKVAEWLVTEGQQVTKGTPLLELETDKVTMEICAEANGVMSQILAVPGTEVDENTPLGLMQSSTVSAIEPIKAAQTKTASSATSSVPRIANNAEQLDITLPADQLEGLTAKIAHWLIDVGDPVEQGAPLLELETDKVTLEVIAPASGVLLQQDKQPGDDVEEGCLLGKLTQHIDSSMKTTDLSHAIASTDQANDHQPASDARNARHLIGPAVRRLLDKHGLDINLINGSGRGGRVTRDDVLAYLDAPIDAQSVTQATATPVTSAITDPTSITEQASRLVPHSPMRKSIASHMVKSLLQTAPHVTSVFEMDMGRIIEHRKQCQLGFTEAGVKLTYTAYFLAATVKAMHAVPSVNARFHEEALEIFSDINIGIGTALGDKGLVVPVVKQVQNKNLFEIASALQQQTEKARLGKLTAADLKGGTFTLSNHGVSGSLFAAPIIINQPQVAILGIGKLEKRVVVEEVDGEDIMTIRPKCYVSLSIDHRALDAYQTNLFLTQFVDSIENWGK